MKKKIYINVGDVFGRLTILEELPINKNRIRKIYVKCDCGTLKIVNLYDVIHRKILSCGCLMKQQTKAATLKHGLSNTAEYHVWWDIIDRCNNKKSKAYKYYGARGIFVCEEWKLNFINFLKDVGKKPFKNAQIDRINNNDGYYKNNVHWVTPSENSKNKRNTNFYVVNNIIYNSSDEAAKATNIKKATLIGRCKKGIVGYGIIKKYK